MSRLIGLLSMPVGHQTMPRCRAGKCPVRNGLRLARVSMETYTAVGLYCGTHAPLGVSDGENAECVAADH